MRDRAFSRLDPGRCIGMHYSPDGMQHILVLAGPYNMVSRYINCLHVLRTPYVESTRG
jgi:hypothetical protein